MKRAIAIAALAVLSAQTARADESTCTPNAERGAKTSRIVGDMLRVAREATWSDPLTLRAKANLATVKATPSGLQRGAAIIRCDAAALEEPDDRKTMLTFADDADNYARELGAAVTNEEECRTSDRCMGDRVCETIGGKQQAEAWRKLSLQGIAQEKANPSGVVNLVRLHDLGQDVQNAEAQMRAADVAIVASKAQFAAARHKPFTLVCR